jgi:hypothetical protein
MTRRIAGTPRSCDMLCIREPLAMAQRTRVAFTDDIPDTEVIGTVQLALAGISYAVDLSMKNADKLATVFKPYLDPARKTDGRTSAQRRAPHARPEPWDVRAWARAARIDVTDKSRIPTEPITASTQPSKATNAPSTRSPRISSQRRPHHTDLHGSSPASQEHAAANLVTSCTITNALTAYDPATAARTPIMLPAQGRTLPLGTSLRKRPSSVLRSTFISDLCGAMGIRTPDLLHAMNH